MKQNFSKLHLCTSEAAKEDLKVTLGNLKIIGFFKYLFIYSNKWSEKRNH